MGLSKKPFIGQNISEYFDRRDGWEQCPHRQGVIDSLMFPPCRKHSKSGLQSNQWNLVWWPYLECPLFATIVVAFLLLIVVLVVASGFWGYFISPFWRYFSSSGQQDKSLKADEKGLITLQNGYKNTSKFNKVWYYLQCYHLPAIPFWDYQRVIWERLPVSGHL